MAHAGSWFGLPDFGITEKIGSFLGGSNAPLTAQGGSNINLSQPSPSVLGTTTSQPSGPGGAYPIAGGVQPGGAYPIAGGVPAGSSGGSVGLPPQDTGQQQQGEQGPNPQDEYNRMLDQKYSELFGNIDQLSSQLPGQRASQEKIVTNQADITGNTLTNTFNTNQNTLQTNQTKNLNDLSQYLQQAWQQGNNMLGTRGASDSSAANQYSYALAKQGSQQRGDIMQQTEQLQNNLKTAYDTEMKNNDLEKQNQLLNIAQWFTEAQNEYQGKRAEVQAQMSSDSLNYALQLVNQAQEIWAQKKSTLDQWAANKAQSLPQLTQMLNQNSQGMPTFQGNMNAGINSNAGSQGFYGYRNNPEDQTGLQ